MLQNTILTYSLRFCYVWFMELFLVDHSLLSRILMVPLWILSSLEFSVMQIKVESPFSTTWPGPFCSSSSGSHICCVHCCVAQMFGFHKVFWIYFVFLWKLLFLIRFWVPSEKQIICKHSHLCTEYQKNWIHSYVKAENSSNKYCNQKTECCSNVLSTTEWKFWKWSLRKWDGAQKFSNEHHFQQVGFAINQLSQISSYHDTKPLFG